MTTTFKTKFTNTADGTESRIVESARGFHVTFWDTDAGEVFPIARIFPLDAEAKAVALAKEWANVN